MKLKEPDKKFEKEVEAMIQDLTSESIYLMIELGIKTLKARK